MTIYVAIALLGFIASLLYLADFIRASRNDALFASASTAAGRRARRAAGLSVYREVDMPARSRADARV